jgi:hypothetical protein
LYATTAEASANHLVTVTDAGVGSTFTTLATAPTNTVFRGVRLIVPGPIVSTVGAGCAGTGGLAPILSTTQVPSFGNLGFSVGVTQGNANSSAFLFASIGTDPIGTPVGGGCTAYLDLPTLILLMQAGITPTGPFPTDGAGAAIMLFPIPYVPALAGIHVGLQSIVFDAGNMLGFTLSNALDLQLF